MPNSAFVPAQTVATQCPSTPGSQYSADYFERGADAGLSLYTDFRWLGAPTVMMCRRIAEYLGLTAGARVLDFGCAKGYVVKGLRLLGMEAWGTDISEYAISSVDPDVAKYCWHTSRTDASQLLREGLVDEERLPYDAVLAKDVLEHISEDELPTVLRNLAQVSRSLFLAVPLGDGGRYFIEEYDLDVTHVIRRESSWWCDVLEESGWRIRDRRHKLADVKDQWAWHPFGNLFATADSTPAR